tara:strand:+ start:2531 stop:2815 length:285 start_codon:yes stop_codon:yes gene_type:complete
MSKIYPVLLAGGSGTRIWSLSCKSYPKQFSNLLTEQTLFQQAALRLTFSSEEEFASHITLLHSESESQQIVGLGSHNIIAVAMSDAVLVTNNKN